MARPMTVKEMSKHVEDLCSQKARDINNGGPAFPCEIILDNGCVDYCYGMTLRDYFAAKAMQALIASRRVENESGHYDEDRVAESSYNMADAMLAEREK